MTDCRDRWPLEIRHGPAALLLAGAAGVWIATTLGVSLGALPRWTLVVVALGSVLAVVRVAQAAARRRRARVDELAPWRGRAVRAVELRTQADGHSTVTFELAADGERDPRPELLRFHGVDRLQLQQLDGEPLRFDGLSCEPLDARGRDGSRYEVRDVWDDRVRFRCRSFDAVPVPGTDSA
jgi:hypothetical protein